MKEKFIPLVTMLSAGAVTCFICLIKPIDTLRSLIYLLVVLIVFYIIGCIAKKIIDKEVDKANKAAEERAMHEEYLRLKEQERLEEEKEAARLLAEAQKTAESAE